MFRKSIFYCCIHKNRKCKTACADKLKSSCDFSQKIPRIPSGLKSRILNLSLSKPTMMRPQNINKLLYAPTKKRLTSNPCLGNCMLATVCGQDVSVGQNSQTTKICMR